MVQRQGSEHPLKMVLMSATIDPTKFVAYFGQARALGRVGFPGIHESRAPADLTEPFADLPNTAFRSGKSAQSRWATRIQ